LAVHGWRGERGDRERRGERGDGEGRRVGEGGWRRGRGEREGRRAGAPVIKFAGLCSMVRRVEICTHLFSVVHYYQKMDFFVG